MSKILSTLLIIAAPMALPLTAAPASAETIYPWCAQYGGDNDGTNCGFSTIAQCQAALSGNGGFCVQNPFFRGSADQAGAREDQARRRKSR